MTTTFYVDRSSPLHGLNPVTKLVAGLALIVMAFALSRPWWASAVLFVVVLVPAVAIGGVQRRFFAMLAKFLLPLLVMLFIVQSLFYPGGREVIFGLGPITVEREGVLFAAQTASRLLVLVGVFAALLLTTHAGRMMAALVQRGMSPKISYVVSATLQIIPNFQRRADAIVQAQRARGLDTEGSRWRRAKALVPLLSPLVLGAFTEVGERAVAIEARAFTVRGPKTSLVVIPDSRTQQVARWGLVLLAVGAVVSRLWV